MEDLNSYGFCASRRRNSAFPAPRSSTNARNRFTTGSPQQRGPHTTAATHDHHHQPHAEIETPRREEPDQLPQIQRSGGVVWAQGEAASSAPAIRNKSTSRSVLATICRPTGIPMLVNPHGTDAAGFPVRLKG